MFNISNYKTNTKFEVLQQNYCIKMDMSRNVSTQLNQEHTLSGMNNEAVIKVLDLDGHTETGMLLDDIVEYLDLDSFSKNTTVVPVADTGVVAAAVSGIEKIQGHQLLAENGLGHYEIPVPHVISYIDLSPAEIDSSPTHVPKSCLTPPRTPQDVSGFAPTPIEEKPGNYLCWSLPASRQEFSSVEKQDAHKPAVGKAPRRKRELKAKLYQCEEPLSDPVEEKKRQNAINAKKNRDKQKNRLQELENLVTSLTAERNSHQSTNTKLINKCDAFEKQLMRVCQQFNVPVIILPQD